jgi:hypothetical protein
VTPVIPRASGRGGGDEIKKKVGHCTHTSERKRTFNVGNNITHSINCK